MEEESVYRGAFGCEDVVVLLIRCRCVSRIRGAVVRVKKLTRRYSNIQSGIGVQYSLIIKDFGFTTLQTTLLNIPSGATVSIIS